MVVCCDVLEHIEPQHLDETISAIFERAEKYVYITICCIKSQAEFPDGQNLHLSIHPPSFWLAKLEPYATKLNYHGTENGLLAKIII